MKIIQFKQFSLVLTSLILFSGVMRAAAPNPPTNLKSCDIANPVGTDNMPYFGWLVNDDDNNEIQTGFQILVSSSLENCNADKADMWNSEKVTSSDQNYVYYQGKSLNAASKYYWKVRTWDKDGKAGAYSEPVTFETGLFTIKDWAGAKWIKRDNNEDDDYTYYRKKFNLENKKIKRAIAYVSANHEIVLYLNNQFVDKGQVFHYPQYQYYNAYDVTGAIKAGNDNIFAALIHWYGGGQGRPKSVKGFLLKTIVEYEDGSISNVVTDASWKVKRAEKWVGNPGKRGGEGIGYIETVDANKVISDWNLASYDDSKWDNANEIGEMPVKPFTVAPQPNLTRLIEKKIKPVSVEKLSENSFVIDLGKVYSGSPVITFEGGKAGDTVNMQAGYTLNDDGTVDTYTTQDCKMQYYYILDGKKSTFEPFVYLGMRYIQVDNAPNELTVENTDFTFRYYDMDPSKSKFTSSNEMLNKVWELMKHSILLGAQESFVDTPTREKGGFLGDAWSQGVPAMTVMHDRTMNLRILLEFLDSQDQYWPDGRLNAVYPNGDGGRDIPDYTQSYLVWIWDYYMQTGNVNFLKENYTKLRKVAEYVDTYKNDTTQLIHFLAGGRGPYEFGIIDWPQQMRYGYDVETVSRTVVDAYAYIDYDIIAKIAYITGNEDDVAKYTTKAEEMKAAINKNLINSEGVYIDGLKKDHSPSTLASQHANMMPMAMGIVPEANFEAVINKIKEKKMSVGMVTVRWLPEAIGLAGEGEHLIELYTNTQWDGWARIIELGGTATWESWDANENKMSQSHPWGVVGLLGMQQYILGVKTIEPQHNLIQIKPLDFGDKLTSASGVVPCDRGDISIEWKKSKKKYILKTTIPDNVTANIYVPKGDGKDNVVLVNKVKVNADEEKGYLIIEDIGSGSYEIER